MTDVDERTAQQLVNDLLDISDISDDFWLTLTGRGQPIEGLTDLD